MMNYKKKASQVEAFKYGVDTPSSWFLDSNVCLVRIDSITGHAYVDNKCDGKDNCTHEIKQNDYVCLDDDNNIFVLSEEEFNTKYELA